MSQSSVTGQTGPTTKDQFLRTDSFSIPVFFAHIVFVFGVFGVAAAVFGCIKLSQVEAPGVAGYLV